ncbi:MAG: proline--tRNA ligase [Clostridia bacterium]|nr:proline--tRNA ligase [Clostridia bacterium]
MSNKKEFVKDITNIDEDFAQWYTDIVLKAQLADYTTVKGFISIRPYGYAIWEQIQNYMDKKFKEHGVKNVSMPVLIPESLLNKEKDHVEGFAPEVAWVTMGGGEELEERLCVRPTSETVFSTMYAKWLNSWRDLPFLYNQWCSVLRWEKETRPFLRSREFLWQEGHTIHETSEEAKKFTLDMLDVYADVIENLLAIPVLKGQKTKKEQFAGAEATYTVETLMHDGRALQGGTSHYFGQNFTKPFCVKFQNRNGEQEYGYQTSWGVSTRLIGAVIMAHGDNRGLKLPPYVAPIQAVIVPIAQQKEGVLETANKIKQTLSKKFRVELDSRDNYTVGYKFNDWEMRGVPVRIEMGPKEIEQGEVILTRRDTLEKMPVKIEELEKTLENLLQNIQQSMFEACKKRREEKTTVALNMEELEKNLNDNQGYVKTMWCGLQECEDKVKEVTGAPSRCMPFEQEHLSDTCVCCGKKADKMIVWGRQY